MRWVEKMIFRLSGLGNCLGIGVYTKQTCIQGEIRLGLEVVTTTKGKKRQLSVKGYVWICAERPSHPAPAMYKL